MSTSGQAAPAGTSLARPRRLNLPSFGSIFLGAIVIIYLVWSLAPVVIAFVFSFNASRSRSVWQGFSTEWWSGAQSVFHDPIYYGAIRQSLLLAVLTVVISVPVGVSLAVFLSRWRGAAARPATFLSTLPLVVPELVLALSLFFLLTKLVHFIPLGTAGQVIGQVTYILPLVIVITRGRLSSIPPDYEEAAMDLGASPLIALRLALVPLLQPAILASAIVAFAVSIDDFVITQYMSSSSSTQSVPMVIYNSTRGSASPALNASAMVMAVTTIVICGLGYLVYRVVNRRETIVLPQASTESAAIGPALSEGVW